MNSYCQESPVLHGRRSSDLTSSRQEARPLLTEAAFGLDFFNSSLSRRQRLTCDGCTSWSLQTDSKESSRAWRPVAIAIISCFILQVTILLPVVGGIVNSVLFVLLVIFRLDLDCVRNITFGRVCSCETGYECIWSSVVVVGVLR